MKKNKRLAITIICLILMLAAVLLILYFNELRTLSTLKRVNDHPIYSMTYSGDYGFDDFLKIGAKTNKDIENFVTKRLLKGLQIRLTKQGDACSAFVAKNEKGEILYGRNFDWDYAPALQLTTRPENGYASISTVDIAYLGYSETNLPDEKPFSSFLTLAAPYLTFDGMNEKGLAVAFFAVVEESKPPYDPNKITLQNTATNRLLLDKAATVDEAVELLKQYNMSFEEGVPVQIFIADATGKSVIVEYWDNEMQIIESNEAGKQCVTNFIIYNNLNIGRGGNEFERYNSMKETLEKNNGVISDDEAIQLLASIGAKSDISSSVLQWSVLYNLTTLEGCIFAIGESDNIHFFKLQ